MTSVTVVIPSHNRPELLHDALQSIMDQTHPADEVIVVDDGSEQAVSEAQLRERYGSTIRVLRNDQAHGLAWARNQGAEAASSELVAHLDDDDRYAPETLGEAVQLFESEPSREVIFLGAKGFGRAGEYFDKALGKGVSEILRSATNREIGPDIFQFDNDLMRGLLKTVPSTFQHVVSTRQAWLRISGLRRKAFMLDPEVNSELEAKLRIIGPLRDSEWGLYAAAACGNAVLLNRPRYLARCDGQGYSSVPKNRERHMLQQLIIKETLYSASQELPELTAWNSEIGENLAELFFTASFYYFYQRNRHVSWRYLLKALRQHPRPKHAKFFLRTLLPVGKVEED